MLSGKCVVVTGGAGLLGRQLCDAIATRGGVAIVADIDLARAQQVADAIVSAGGRGEAASLNIADPTSVDTLIADLDRRHGRIDAVVNSAYPRTERWGQKIEDVTYEDFCKHLSLHVGGYFLVAQRFALYFRAHGGGSIVNIASIYGAMAPRFDLYAGTAMTMPVEYAAIKSAIIHLTRYFAQYFSSDGVRCNALSPGGIRDGQPDAFQARYRRHCGTKGLLDPQDVAGALLFLLSDDARFVNGQNLIVDDGFSL